MSDKYHWPIFGHKQAIQFLQNSIEQEKLAHAYLFYGSKGLGKKMIANYFASSIFCTSVDKKPCGQCKYCRLVAKNSYLDLYTLGKDDQELSVENVREFMHSLQMANIYSNKKIAIIYNVEKINIFGANALLKTLARRESPIGISLPNFVELKVIQADPGIKGDTAAGATKPVTMQTGLILQVPLFIEEGETLKVDTRSGSYVERVKST